MSLTVKTSKLGDILSLIVTSILTILAIFNEQVSVFYVLYLFWIDELLKTIFDFLEVKFRTAKGLKKQTYMRSMRQRFFMLFIYFFFIVVCFGFMLDFKSENVVFNNFQVFFFHNIWFNLSVFSFLIREILAFYYDRDLAPFIHHVLSKGIITLHISIILGVFIWAILSGTLTNKTLQGSSYISALSILPFLILKCFFEYQEIKLRHKKNQ